MLNAEYSVRFLLQFGPAADQGKLLQAVVRLTSDRLVSRKKKIELINALLSADALRTVEAFKTVIVSSIELNQSALAFDLLTLAERHAKSKQLRLQPVPSSVSAAGESDTEPKPIARVPRDVYVQIAEKFASAGDISSTFTVLQRMVNVGKHVTMPVDAALLAKALSSSAAVKAAASVAPNGPIADPSLQYLAAYASTPPGAARAAEEGRAWDGALGALGGIPSNSSAAMPSDAAAADSNATVLLASELTPSKQLEALRHQVSTVFSAENMSWLSLCLLEGVVASVKRSLSRNGRLEAFEEQSRRESAQHDYYGYRRRELQRLQGTPEYAEYMASNSVPLQALQRCLSTAELLGTVSELSRLIAVMLPYLKPGLKADDTFPFMHALIDAGQARLALYLFQCLQRAKSGVSGYDDSSNAALNISGQRFLSGAITLFQFSAAARATAFLPGRVSIDTCVELAGLLAGQTARPSPTAYALMIGLCLDTLQLEASLDAHAAYDAAVAELAGVSTDSAHLKSSTSNPALSNRRQPPRRNRWPGDEPDAAIEIAEGRLWPPRPALVSRATPGSSVDAGSDGGTGSEESDGVVVEYTYESSDDGGSSDGDDIAARLSSAMAAAESERKVDSPSADKASQPYSYNIPRISQADYEDGDDDDVDPLYRAFTLYDSHSSDLRPQHAGSSAAVNISFVVGALEPSPAAVAAWTAHASRHTSTSASPSHPPPLRPLVHVALEALRKLSLKHFMLARRRPGDVGSGSDVSAPTLRSELPPAIAVDLVDEGMYADLHTWHWQYLRLEARHQAALDAVRRAAASSGGGGSSSASALTSALAQAESELRRARSALVARATALPTSFPGAQGCALALIGAMGRSGWEKVHVRAVARWLTGASPLYHAVTEASQRAVDEAVAASEQQHSFREP